MNRYSHIDLRVDSWEKVRAFYEGLLAGTAKQSGLCRPIRMTQAVVAWLFNCRPGARGGIRPQARPAGGPVPG